MYGMIMLFMKMLSMKYGKSRDVKLDDGRQDYLLRVLC